MTAVFLPHRPDERAAIPDAARDVVAEFAEAHGRRALLWIRDDNRWRPAPNGASGGDAPVGSVAEVPNVGGTVWVEVERRDGEGDEVGDALAGFLAGTVSRLVAHHGEVDFFSRELSERYEEITLLYSISEILGSVISLDHAASTILHEVVGVLEAKRASLWVHEEPSGDLVRTASVGLSTEPRRIREDDPIAVTARVFRDREAMLLEPGEALERNGASGPSEDDSVLSVPLSYTPPEGPPRTVGVINLIGRRQGGAFNAGDLKLLSAIASQVGAALENSRLIATTVRHQRVLRELELAHDLQLKLLPPVERVQELADVGAACRPAESVGGDFYHLFRLSGGRVGVMIGDVSTHGFRAALIMALAMSAVGVHAAEGDAPSRVLDRVRDTILSELKSTEMYITLVYAVIDPGRGTLTYSNAGHPHAFHFDAAGPRRLEATDPPLGLVETGEFAEAEVRWVSGSDLLLLYTDGITDALGAQGGRDPETRVLEAVTSRLDAELQEVADMLVDLPAERGEVPADDRTAVLIRV